MSMDHLPRCRDCGEHHRTGREAIECDLRLGKQPPGLVAHTREEIDRFTEEGQ